MASFPAPHLERRRFQTLPDEGTILTEAALLQLLYDLLKPLEAITYAFELAHDQMDSGEATDILVGFIQEILEQAVLLLEAWHEHQPPPGRQRATPTGEDHTAAPPARGERRRRPDPDA